MRKITISLVVEDAKAAEVLWESFKNNTTLNGCRITSIGNGNIFDHLEMAEALLGDEEAEIFEARLAAINAKEHADLDHLSAMKLADSAMKAVEASKTPAEELANKLADHFRKNGQMQ